MKLKLALLTAAVFISTSALAAPRAEGIYVGDSTISHAPPRTTIALVEPNGEVWSAVDWYTGTAGAIYGDINKKGDGFGSEFAPTPTDYSQPLPGRVPLRITTAVTNLGLRFTFFFDTAPPFQQSWVHHQLQPMGKRGAYDVELNKALPQVVDVPPSVYTQSDFSMSVTPGDRFTATYDNCTLSGGMSTAAYFKRVNATIRADCYVGVDLLKKGTKLEGVIFPATRVQGGDKLLVLIMKVKTGESYVGFSRTFSQVQ